MWPRIEGISSRGRRIRGGPAIGDGLDGRDRFNFFGAREELEVGLMPEADKLRLVCAKASKMFVFRTRTLQVDKAMHYCYLIPGIKYMFLPFTFRINPRSLSAP